MVTVPVRPWTWSKHATAICRAAGAAGEATPRPYMGWVADQRRTLDLPRWDGAAPLCRGQAHARGWLWISVFVQPPCVGVRRCLTRRPARAGNPTPMAAAVPLPITVQAVGIERPGLQPRAESPSPLKGAGRGAAGAANPPLGERHLDQPARGLRPAVFTPRSRRPRGGPGMAAGRTMMGRRCCPPIRLA
jgi:hypothetical protein